jgi:hypothetical protein
LYIGFVFFKVLAVTLWTMPSALAIMRLTPLLAIVAGATLSALPTIALILFVCLSYVWISGYWRERWDPTPRVRSNQTETRSRARRWRHSVRTWIGTRGSMLSCLFVLGLVAVALAPAGLVLLGAGSAIVVGIGARRADRLVRRRRLSDATATNANRHTAAAGPSSPQPRSVVRRASPPPAGRRWCSTASDTGKARLTDGLVRERIKSFRERTAIAAGGLFLGFILLPIGYYQIAESMCSHTRICTQRTISSSRQDTWSAIRTESYTY